MSLISAPSFAATAFFAPRETTDGLNFVSIGHPVQAGDVAEHPELAGFRIHEFLVTTNADDILSVDSLVIESQAPIYNGDGNATGVTFNPICLVAKFAGDPFVCSGDSWIRTPGNFVYLQDGSSSPDPFASRFSAWFDASNDGPQTNFTFMRLVTIGGSVRGRLNVAANGFSEVQSFDFHFIMVPEPASWLAATMACGVAIRRRATPRRRATRNAESGRTRGRGRPGEP